MTHQDKDLFSLVHGIVRDLRDDNCLEVDDPDYATAGLKARLVTSPDFPADPTKFEYVVKLAETAFLSQMTAEDRANMSDDFSFVPARIQNERAVYIKTPAAKHFDFAALQTYINDLEDMYAPKPLSAIDGEYRDDPYKVCVGPVKFEEHGSTEGTGIFETVIDCMAGFNGVKDLPMASVSGNDGMYFIFNKADYGTLLGNQDVLRRSTLYRNRADFAPAPALVQ